MDIGLKGKRALVTAASQGLGRAIAEALVSEGCQVVISSRRQERLEEVADEISRTCNVQKGTVIPIAADVTKNGDIQQLIKKAEQQLGGLDLLVTNAGGPPAGQFEQFSDEDWLAAVNLNLMSVVRLVRETLPIMKRSGGGKILNVSSMSVKQPIPNLILSNTIRTGTAAMLKTLAAEVAKDNIQVVNLAPGRIKTARLDSLDGARAEREGRPLEEVQAAEQEKVPMGRYGTPEEFGRLAAFLLSPANSYMTGQTVLADGGVVQSM
ncbi:SDR family oxidoreductase [Planococcus lenghuensis]|uniref:3-oxoacyl-ACP reductase n=1 Tax=Planococcus lenghuensis TaxID=2213202 RepID=A0A1Q2L485_9BACL|nr:SDR family oxidoreductase [Planococcus lenghuensis]AQQ54877.1 3-oxoacyl-ACP reductase [Planococcus lenghuensis]